MSIPVQDLGWMAGVIDLKGRLVRKNNKSRALGSAQLVLYVESKEFLVVRDLSRMTGTAPEMQNAKRLSDWLRHPCLEHCPEPHSHVRAEGLEMPSVVRWTITGAGMAVVLYNLLPYMRNDRGFSEAMQEAFNQMVTEGRGSGTTLKSLARLHELGWDFPPNFAIPEERLAIAKN